MRLNQILLYPAVALAVAACEREAQSPAVSLELAQPCEVEAGCVAETDDLTMRFALGPELRALSPFPVRVELQSDRQVDSVIVSFAMKDMDMGPNRYLLISDGAHRWLGNATLPVCTSGRSDWVARFEVTAEGRRLVAEVPFMLSR